MAKIITFERISWIINANNKFLELDYRVDANVTGVLCRKLKNDDILIFCNHNPSISIPHIFAHKLGNTGEIINNPIYFTNSILNTITLCQSMEQLSNYSIMCTSMQKDITAHDIVYWNDKDEQINNNTVEISKIYSIKGIRTNILTGLYNGIYEPNLSISDIDVTGITVNKRNNTILFSIGNIEAGDEYVQQGIIMAANISYNTSLSISDDIRVVNKYDTKKLFSDNNLEHGELSYITDMCFDNESHTLILLTSCGSNSCGYIWTVKWYNSINIYSSIPKLVRSNYDNEILKFNQTPKGITKINKPNTYAITFKYDEELVFNQHFDHCIIELNL